MPVRPVEMANGLDISGRRALLLSKYPPFAEALRNAFETAAVEAIAASSWTSALGQFDFGLAIETDNEAYSSLATTLPFPLVVCCEVDRVSLSRAFGHGAAGIVDVYLSPDEIVGRVLMVFDGLVVLPIETARQISVSAGLPSNLMSDSECQWLGRLAQGASVAHLAMESALSEREMYRRLSQLYRRMKAAGREHAIALAARTGVLDAWLL